MGRTIFLLAIFLITSFSCRQDRIQIKVKNQLLQKGFDFNYWKKDSMGCNVQEKQRNAKILYREDSLKYCTKKEIINMLGKPNEIKKIKKTTIISYVIDGNLICQLWKDKQILTYEGADCIAITFDENDKFSGISYVRF